MVKNHWEKINNSRFHIRIRIFTKIESIQPCDTANLEPVHQVLSVSVHYFLKHCGMYNFLDIMLSPLSLNGEESRKKIQVVRSWSVHNSIRIRPSILVVHKISPDLSANFWDILYTNRQTNRQKGIKTSPLSPSVAEVTTDSTLLDW